MTLIIHPAPPRWFSSNDQIPLPVVILKLSIFISGGENTKKKRGAGGIL